MTEHIGIDLGQGVAYLFSDSAQHLDAFTAIPSVVLPAYHGEACLFGLQAQLHRRGRGWEWPPESNISSECGCGRVPLIAAFERLRKVDEMWSQHQHVQEGFDWNPNGTKMLERASDLIVGYARQLASEKPHVLVIPDSYQEIAQERLKTSKVNKSRQDLRFIPRSMAAALQWIEQANLRVDSSNPGFIGHIRVCSFGLDEWTLRTVPLSIVEVGCTKYLVPVFDPMTSTESLGIHGLVVAILSAIYNLKTSSYEVIWENVLTGSFLSELVKNVSPDAVPNLDVLNGIHFTQPLQDCLKRLPHCADIASNMLSSTNLIHQASKIWTDLQQRLPEGSSKLLGTVVDGSFSHFPMNDHYQMSCLASQGATKDCDLSIWSPSRPSLASEGAAIFSKKIEQNVPTFNYSLIPIDIYCVKPEGCSWVSLIGKTDAMDAGLDQRCHKLSGFWIQAGASELQFTLKRPKLGVAAGHIYKTIKSEKFSDVFSQDVPVNLSINVKPGDGFASVQVISSDGIILSELDWANMEDCEEPTRSDLGYLQDLLKVTSRTNEWREVVALVAKWENTRTNRARCDILDLLLNKLRKTTPNKEAPFESFAAISSDGTVCSNTSALNKLKTLLAEAWTSEQFPDFQRRLPGGLSRLFTAAPHAFKQHVRKVLSSSNLKDIKLYVLQAAERIFDHIDDFKRFYQAFQRKVQSGRTAPTGWIRTLRMITARHANALTWEAIDDETLTSFVQYICQVILDRIDNGTCKTTEMACVRALCSLLYRRRYDPSFLPKDSTEFLLIESTLESLWCIASDKQQEYIDTALRFLREEATQTDAYLLYTPEEEESD